MNRPIRLLPSRLLSTLLLAATVLCAVPRPAAAQSIDEALRLYKGRDYKDAVLLFYDILANDPNPDVRDQAQVYLAETLRKMELWVPALFYYSDLFKAGRQNRYYLNAVEGLLAIAQLWHDPVIVPSLINALLDTEGLAQLDPQKIAHVNYMVGELAYRGKRNQEARDFLVYVPPESPYHPKARYLLGLLSVREGKGNEALEHFKAILDIIDEDSEFDDLRRLRHLAIIGTGRTAYGEGRFAESTEYYGQVPRFSESWFTAMYEGAWGYFRQEDYGRALGAIQSVTSPYFSKRHVPEAYVIAAITFFVNCQWDRVRREVEKFKANYEPMLAALQRYLEGERQPADYYRDIIAGGGRDGGAGEGAWRGPYSIEIARDVRRMKRFKDYFFMLEHLRWERAQLQDISEWQNSRMQEQMLKLVDLQVEDLEPAVGAWVKLQLSNRAAGLQNFQNQMNIFDFEVADAERRWLEQGQEILKGRRAKLPRPRIPNDQWQHWSFDKEYWKDELGFLQHTIATECRDEPTEE